MEIKRTAPVALTVVLAEPSWTSPGMTTRFESEPATRQIMTQPTNPRAKTRFAKLSPPWQWVLLIAGSVPFAALLEVAALPAALLLGPMIAGIVVGCNGGTIRAPRLPVFAAQTIVGCLVARAVHGRYRVQVPQGLAALPQRGDRHSRREHRAIGWLLARWRVLPGTTAVWGTAPGGASVMMLMSGAFGADARLVALMQYLRVVLVAAVASAGCTAVGGCAWWLSLPDPPWFPAVRWQDFIVTLMIAGLGGALGPSG